MAETKLNVFIYLQDINKKKYKKSMLIIIMEIVKYIIEEEI
jgi:hypothetical protein